MRICDLCKAEFKKGPFTEFDFAGEIGGVKFGMFLSATKEGERLDICPDCAAKGALAVLGVNPTEPKKETP